VTTQQKTVKAKAIEFSQVPAILHGLCGGQFAAVKDPRSFNMCNPISFFVGCWCWVVCSFVTKVIGCVLFPKPVSPEYFPNGRCYGFEIDVVWVSNGIVKAKWRSLRIGNSTVVIGVHWDYVVFF
jgi:hypothetical protein